MNRPFTGARCIVALALSSAALVAHADDNSPLPSAPEIQRGVDVNTLFAGMDADSVNLYNGNLSIRVPIGSVVASPRLSADLALHYNSDVWASKKDHCLVMGSIGGPPTEAQELFVPIPSPFDNAGMGWSLSLGEIVAADIGVHNPEHNAIDSYYRTPSGSLIVFETRLRDQVPANTTAQVRYSRDGSYLRRRDGASGCATPAGSSSPCSTIEFPDGVVHEFHQIGDRFRPTRMRDSFGNLIDIAYDGHSWTLSARVLRSTHQHGSNTHARIATLRFHDGGQAYRKLDYVDVPSPAGVARYKMEYQNATVRRHRWEGFPNAHDIRQQAGCLLDDPIWLDSRYPANLSVDLLSGVALPTLAGNRPYYAYTYTLRDFPGAGGGDTTQPMSGAMRTSRLPTGLYTEYGYRLYNYNQNGQPIWKAHSPIQRHYGIGYRERYAQTGSGRLDYGTWTYGNPIVTHVTPADRQAGVPGRQARPCYLITRVSAPDGTRTDHYFQNAKTGLVGLSGLPLSFCDPDSGDYHTPQSREHLSSRMYDSANRLVRAVTVKYAFDALFDGSPQVAGRNPHVVARTEYTFQPGSAHSSSRRTVYEQHDGFGHFGRISEGVDVHGGGGGQRRVESSFLPASLPGVNHYWLLGLETSRKTSLGAAIAEEIRRCYASGGQGFLEAQSWQGAFQPFLATYEADSRGRGYTVQTSLYGGKGGKLNLDPSGCRDSNGDADPIYELKTVHEYGVPSRSVFLSGGSDFLERADADVDADSGAIVGVTGADGVYTSASYDALGRLLQRQHGSDGSEHFSYYFPEAAGQRPNFETWQCPGAGTCGLSQRLASSGAEFDHRGLLHRDWIRRPSGADASRWYAHDAMGRRLWETVASHAASDNGLARTTYSGHDAFGRPGSVTRPDGQSSSFSYTGITTVDEQVPDLRRSRKHYDGFGNLIAIEEPLSGASLNALTLTSYAYDAMQRLVAVCQNDSDWDASSCSGAERQSRQYVYDGLGHLVTQTDPEGGVTSSRFDPLGNPLESTIGSITLDHSYDAAGRPLRLRQQQGPTLTDWYYYGASARVGNRHQLESVRQYNRIPVPETASAATVSVENRYVYEIGSGRPETVETLVTEDRVGTQRFSLGLGYSAAGDVSLLRYPVCVEGCTNSLPAFDIQYTLANRQATAINGVPISYHADGSVAQVDQGTHVTVYNKDAWQFRLASISAGSNGAIWQSGSYVYDAAGQITGIGADRYAYDKAGRVISSTVSGTVEAASYDLYGNLLSLGPTSLQINARSNRLSQVNGKAVHHDDRGQVTSLPLAGKRLQLAWDPQGRLASVEPQHATESSPRRSFAYDANGQRVLVIDHASGRRDYALRGLDGKILRQVSRANAQAAPEVERNHVFLGTTLVAEVRHQANGLLEITRVHADHLGTPRAWSRGSGGSLQIERMDLHAFGNIAGGDLGSHTLGFTGHERDQDADGGADLDQMMARYYGPGLGRFLSPDPAIGATVNPSTWNRYAYAGNSPLQHTDPDGRLLDTIADVVFVGISAYTLATDPNWTNAAALAADVAGLALPFATGLGSGVRAINATADVVKAADASFDAARTAERTVEGARVAENAAQGAAAERVVAKTAGSRLLGTNITIVTSKGTRTRIDNLLAVDGGYGVSEVKSGAAKLSQAQKDLLADIAAGRAVTPVGARAREAKLMPGQAIRLKSYTVIRMPRNISR